MESLQPSCILCLEPTERQKPSRLSCPCRFQAHEACWKKWEATKGRAECPLCHVSPVTNPLVLVVISEQEEAIQPVRIVASRMQVAYCSGIIVLLTVLIWASTYNGE